jgi:hypothetical protein
MSLLLSPVVAGNFLEDFQEEALSEATFKLSLLLVPFYG